MATQAAKAPTGQPPGFMERVLDGIERVGNKVPHPVMMFLHLIIGVIVLSAILALIGVSVTEEVAVPVPIPATGLYYEDTAEPSVMSPAGPYEQQYELQKLTIPIR